MAGFASIRFIHLPASFGVIGLHRCGEHSIRFDAGHFTACSQLLCLHFRQTCMEPVHDICEYMVLYIKRLDECLTRCLVGNFYEVATVRGHFPR